MVSWGFDSSIFRQNPFVERKHGKGVSDYALYTLPHTEQ